ncbi:MAG: glycerol-3-phosphate 1-O-acyltransferase PlsY [Pseudomonadota bacterium]|nr:glycerol-3-phosphate 1-O-acyltransferase PlsY [Pseudomonadota bacterium]
MLWHVTALVAAYLIGSLSFAVIISRMMGLADPRSYGSGNPGATNVLRSGSKKAAVLTLLFDALKGYVPVALAAAWALPPAMVALVGLAAFLGHLYPVFFRFQGGKGVATAAGVVLALSPWLGLAVLAVFALAVGLWRYVSLASMLAAGAAALLVAAVPGPWPRDAATAAALTAMAALLVWRHRENITRLRAGVESKLGSKKK